LEDKESVATYLNEEFQLYSQRLIDLNEKQLKAFQDAKHLRRRKARQEKSEQRRRGEAVGFEKGNPDFSDSDLPKLTVDQGELKLVKEVRSLLSGEVQLSDEEANDGEKSLFNDHNITNNLPGSSISEVVDMLVANLVKKEVSTASYNTP
jgi:flagellar biosynthesis/type III secretory pathway protein FliH